jgi:hypothetical protein
MIKDIEKYSFLINKKFERLTIKNIYYKFIDKENRNRLFCDCVCDCNNNEIISIKYNAIQTGNVKSCGCLKKEIISQLMKNKRKFNIYEFFENYGIGYFYNTNNFFYFDLEDYDKIKNYCWYEYTGYAVNDYNGRKKMHRFVMSINNSNIKIDHINRNRLDNRKNNLRIVDYSENRINSSKRIDNTSGIIGVYRCNNYWIGSITKNGKRISKRFKEFDEAVFYRLTNESIIFGEYSPQKNLFNKYNISYDK